MSQIRLDSKGIVVLAVFALTPVVSLAGEGEISIGSNGQVKVVEKANEITWQSTGVTVSEQAVKFPEQVAMAYGSPGLVIATKITLRKRPRGLFHLVVTEETVTGVKYDRARARVDLVTPGTVNEVREEFTPFLILVVLAVSLMGVANVMLKKDHPAAAVAAAAAAVAVAAVAVAAVAVAAATAATAVAVAAYAAAAAVVLAVAIDDDSKKIFIVMSWISSILLTIATLLFYF